MAPKGTETFGPSVQTSLCTAATFYVLLNVLDLSEMLSNTAK
jgi:hypothetical protein